MIHGGEFAQRLHVEDMINYYILNEGKQMRQSKIEYIKFTALDKLEGEN